MGSVSGNPHRNAPWLYAQGSPGACRSVIVRKSPYAQKWHVRELRVSRRHSRQTSGNDRVQETFLRVARKPFGTERAIEDTRSAFGLTQTGFEERLIAPAQPW